MAKTSVDIDLKKLDKVRGILVRPSISRVVVRLIADHLVVTRRMR
jgi:hypothetical protein